ncbi:MAG: VCBS repeat-containing protein [Planctomycetaceae bacterium]
MESPILPIVVAFILVSIAGCRETSVEPEAFSEHPDSRSSAFPLVELNTDDVPDSLSVTVRSPQFEDQHETLGIQFIYDNGSDGRALMVQSTGGGGGWLDVDRDSWPDLFFVQGGNPTQTPPHPTGDRLLRNLQGRQFLDVSDGCIPPDGGFGQGVAVGDFDGDGFDDLFVSNTAEDQLLHNCGDGTFQDVTAKSGMADKRWGASAAWYDLDSDGDLDLFVCNYCRYDPFHPIVCRHPDGTPGICHPETLDADFSECYENLGDGTFRAVSETWGFADKPGKALGVVAADFNLDGLPDVFVSNDTMANSLYLGQPDGVFVDKAIALGCGYNALGQYQANMGIACNDYDGNGYLDLYVTTFTHDSNTLFANLGPTGFRDVTRMEGLHSTTIETLGFGTVMSDFNADGAMDLFMTNGHIDDWRYKNELWKMPPELFSYNSGQWQKHSADTAGDFMNEEHLGRAVSMADFDHDGDSDLLVVHQNEPAALLVNSSELGHWLQVALQGSGVNRRGIGARVTFDRGTPVVPAVDRGQLSDDS